MPDQETVSLDPAEIDLYSDGILRDPYPYYDLVRTAGAAVFLPLYDVWGVARYADVKAALLDWRTFSSEQGVFLTTERNREFAGRAVLTLDPPLHDEMRQVYQQHISLKALKSVQREVAQRAEAIVARVVSQGEFDVIADLARPFSVTTASDLVGFPQEGRDRLLDLSNAVFNVHGPQNERHLESLPQVAECFAYIASIAQAGVLAPGSWGAGMFAAANAEGFPEQWAASAIGSFVIAGMDTVMNAIANTIWLLARNPEQLQLLRARRDLASSALGEGLRCESPIQYFSRQTTRDCEIDGVRIPEGSRVLLMYAAANRDPRAFENPDTFDIARQGPAHLGFGFGVHGCVGQALAKLEGTAILEALIDRVGSLEVVEERRHLNNALRGFANLTVRTSPQTDSAKV